MSFVKKILSFLFFVCYTLYAFSAAPAVPPAPGLGPNVRMEEALNVPIAAIAGVPFANANLFDPALIAGALAAAAGAAAAIAVAGVNAGPLGAVPAQIDVHSDTVAVDKFISYCHNSSLGDFDTAAAADAAAGVAPIAAVPGLQMNALINRLREFYSTDINDLSRVLHLSIPVPVRHSSRLILTSDWDSDDLRHITLAAITIISRSQVPVGGAPPVPPQYDYRTFFFGDVFRSGENNSSLSDPFNANIFLPDHFFHIFGRNFPVLPHNPLLPPSLHFSGNWQTVPVNRTGNEAHSEGAFCDFLTTAAAAPFNIRARLRTHIRNSRRIIAFIVHLKNREPMCRMCRSWVPASIRGYLCRLLLNAPITTCTPLTYDPPMKGMHLSPTAAATAAAAAALPVFGLQGSKNNHFPLNSVIFPSLPNIPVPNIAGTQQTVKTVFIIGYGFKNVDILE